MNTLALRRFIALPVVATTALLALTGCMFAPMPVGPMSSEDRDITDVSGIVLDTSGDVTITQGEPSLTIHARADVVSKLTAEVVDGVLTLGRLPGVVFGGGEIRYELTLPSLTSIELNGSGDIESDITGHELMIVLDGSGDIDLRRIDASLVDVEVSGSGDVSLEGATPDLAISVSGSGDVDAENLAAERAIVEIDGSSETTLFVTGTLDAAISGSGTIRYAGGAEVTEDISGSGEIVADDAD